MSEQKVCPTCGTEYPLSERFCPRDGTALRSANASGDLLGTVVADRYHVIKKLGEGGMGAVYLAEHVKMGRKSALKVMHPGMNSDPDAIARFNREASNASRLSHPNICGIYDFGETPEGLIYLAMEFIEGKALTDLIEKDGALAPARAASIVHQTADALQVAHDAGIVHRDLKPDNIMVAKGRDGSDQVKVVDFGIAKASSSDAQKVTKTGLVVGTPEYMSPEQLAGDKLDGRSDIYSLGLVAFNCLTGKLPFPSETAQEAMIMRLTDRPKTLSEMRPDVAWPDTLQQVMDRALSRDAGERYQSAAQFGREFAEAISAMPSTAASEGATMVIGAMPSAADAATKAIPATRVASPSESNSPVKPQVAAPAPVKKSNPIPMLVGGAALVVVAGLSYMKFAGGSPTSSTGADTTGQVAGNPNTATQADTGTTPPTAPTNSKSTSLNNPLPNRPTGTPSTPGTSTQSDPPPTRPSGPTAAQYAEKLAGYQQDLADVNIAPNRVRAIIADVESFQPQLSGSNLAESWYVMMIGYSAVGDDDGACRAAEKVKELSQQASRLTSADMIRRGC